MRSCFVAFVAMAALTACATATMTDRQFADPNEKIARPDRILVHDFAATAAELHPESALSGQLGQRSTPPTAEELETLRKLGASVSQELVTQIRAMGLPAVHEEGEPDPNVGDIVIHGTFVSADEGSATERVVIGFGKGDAELRTFVEGYVMTESGLRRLGSGTVDSGGGKAPGVVIPVLITAATANPVGLIVGGGVKAYGEISGSSKIEGAGKRTAEEIAKVLRPRFEQEGWIAAASN